MALRPIDNALPVSTPERPKKQPKLSSNLPHKPPHLSVNDENRPPLPPPAEAAVDYISSDRLQPVEEPESKIQSVVEGLESKDWIKICESLNDVRRFCIFHSSLLIPVLEKLMIVVVKAMKNPRSALCKTSIMAASDMFNAFGEKLLESDTFDQLLLQLLLKASQDKKFVCEEADRALNAMVNVMAPLSLLSKLRGYGSHTNPRVRAMAAVSISNSVPKMNLEEMKEYGLVLLLEMAAALLIDKLPEAREAARKIVVCVHGAVIENEELKEEAWKNFCDIYLSPIHAQSMTKVVSSQ